MAQAHESGVVHVSNPILVISALPLLCLAFMGRDLGMRNELIVAITRSFVQLMILGLILHPIFTIGMDMPLVVGIYVFFMTLIATRESMTRMKYTYKYHALMTFLAIFSSIIVVGAFAFLVVIRPEPRWNPQYVIPMCGMLLGNCISGVSLTVNDLTKQIMEGGRREIELFLSFGASGWESILRLTKEAVRAGATPTINSLNVIGLVSIPGMMTGQILGGSPVTEAAHYQILIMYLIATCLFCAMFTNVFILYRVAFDAGGHVLRIDRFIELVGNKQNKNQGVGIMDNLIAGFRRCCCGLWGEKVAVARNDSELEHLNNGTGNSVPSNRVLILTRQFLSDGSEPFFRIDSLSFAVPKSHSKQSRHINADVKPPLPPLHLQAQKRVLCTNLNVSLNKGEIAIVRGPSGSGKSTLLRVISGLTPMDGGDVIASGISLKSCSGNRDGRGIKPDMVQWRTNVRYVTQYKVDLPGTPRDFVSRVASFRSHSKFNTPSEDEVISQTASYLQRWGMGEIEYENGHQHPPLEREWKTLSGGESQRMLLAIAMASRGKILLLDEATSGLDEETQKRVEDSVVDYVRINHAAVLWVTHNEDIAERLLAP
ncbi:hypothetical protein ACHAXA_011333 [Cyclostephanos tholiformis]|uniref:ABC transporter domain-containing protein n=1 Tax=Cyclostephanos tholiformis TaxID=382380 RepID=A0ABD3REH4_9STRA